MPTLLVIGSEGFERLSSYLREEGIRSVLISNFRYPTNLDMADVGYHLPGVGSPEDIVRIALHEQATWVISASIPDDLVTRDADVKAILEGTYGIPVAAQPKPAVRIANDKHLTRSFCVRNGFPIAPGMLATTAREVLNIIATIGGFPVVCKDPLGWGGHGMSVVHDSSGLREHFAQMQGRAVLVEQFLNGTEFSVETFTHAGQVLAMAPISKGATSVDGLHAMEHVRSGPCECPGAQELAARAVLRLGSEGPAEVEMVSTPEGLYVTEINPRFSGITQISIPASGIDTYRLLACQVRGTWQPFWGQTERMMAIQTPILVDEAAWPGWQSDISQVPGVKRVIRQPLRRYTGRLTLVGPDSETLRETVSALSSFPDLHTLDAELPAVIRQAEDGIGKTKVLMYGQRELLNVGCSSTSRS